MIKLGVLFPDHLNLNGDLGNVTVIKKQLDWRGVDSVVIGITSEDQLSEGFDLLFLGHGSEAAWTDIESRMPNFDSVIERVLDSDIPFMAVSTGFERIVASGALQGLSQSTRDARTSKFEVAEDGDDKVLGYLNTESDLPLVFRSGALVATMLHGPVLSRNASLLNEILVAISTRAGIDLPALMDAKKADQLADLIAEVWKLEEELASE
jgi:CobQ-like glutamine amidotransferase family enzyme